MFKRKLTTALLSLPLVLALLLSSCPNVAADTDLNRAAATAPIVINEIHYDPLNKTANPEFVELYNPNDVGVVISNWSLAGAVEYVFPVGSWLPPRSYLVIAANPAGFRAVYRIATVGPYRGRLSAGGEELLLRNQDDDIVNSVAFALGFPWPTPNDLADESIGLINSALDNSQPGAWRSGKASPGRANAVLVDNPPPFVDQVEHTPQSPREWDTIKIRAHVTDADGVAAVNLQLQPVAPGGYVRRTDGQYNDRWSTVPMLAVGGDWYEAALPASMRHHRWLIRYRIDVVDKGGRQVRLPYWDDPQPNFALYIYNGVPAWQGAIKPGDPSWFAQVQTYDFAQMRQLPVYQLIANSADVADSQFIPWSNYGSGYMGNDYPWYGTLVYNGVVYDHIRFRARGGEFRYSVGKNHWKFEFNRGHDFQAYDDYGRPYATRWKHLNFSGLLQHTTRRHRGEQGLYETMSYRLFNLFGVPASKTNFLQFRVVDQPWEANGDQYDGDFWGLYLTIENMDGRFLDEHNLPDGNLYDMKGWTGELDHQGNGAPGNNADLNYFLGTYSNGAPDANWWRQNFDLNGYFRFRAVLEAVHSYDVDQGKNYYLFANSDTHRWSVLPWDQDLTWTEDYFGEGAEPFRDRVLPQWEFNIQYQNTLRELRDLLFNPEQIFPMIDEVANLIDTPSGGLSMVDADRALWDYNPILYSRYVVEARSRPGKFYQEAPGGTFRGMTALMREYLLQRAAWIDQTLLTDNDQPYTPAVHYNGPGNYPADRLNFAASGYADPQGANSFAGMQWRTAEIVMPGRPGYDPNRPSHYEAEATWVSPVLTTYASSITLPKGVCRPGYNCRVRVRMLDNTGRWSHWSDPVEFTTGAPVLGPTRDLRVSELMYHAGKVRNLPSADLEFMELTNAGGAAIDLSNMRFTEGIDYVFPAGTTLAPGAHLVLAKNAGYFQDRYGFAPFGVYSRELSNKGERVTLADAFGATVLSFNYSDVDGWPAAADGAGPSLVAATTNESGDPNQVAYWRASTVEGGSPGADDPQPVLINEIKTAPDTGIIEAVELYNPSSQAAPVGNWLLATIYQSVPTDRDAVPTGQYLAADAVVPPGGYLVVETRGRLPVLRVPPGGGALSLYATGDLGRLSGYRHGGTFDAPGDATIGRFVSADGVEHFVRETQPTLRDQNTSPQIGPLVINRILLRSPAGVQGVELVNISDKPIDLYDPNDLSRTWILGGAVFKLPAGIKLPPGGRLRIVNRTPADVCMQSGQAGGALITGPLRMPLTLGGVDLTIMQPISFGGVATYTAADRVRYRNHGPWPPLTGSVVTLQRRSLNGFGDDAMNWDVVPSDFVDTADAFTVSAESMSLCTFDAFAAEKGVRVEWVSPALPPGAKFQLVRTRIYTLQTPEVIAEVAPPKQMPDSTGPTRFEWVDQSATPGQEYAYQLRVVKTDGATQDIALTTTRSQLYVLDLSQIYR